MRWLISCAMFVVSLLAIQNSIAGQPLDLNHLKPDVSPFLAAGCVDNDAARGFLCPLEILKRFGCSDMRMANGVGGLGFPIAACLGRRASPGKVEPGVTFEGCMLKIPIRYIIYTTKGFKVVKTENELISASLPIDSPEKAASLVMALHTNVVSYAPEPAKDDIVKVRDKSSRVSSILKADSEIVIRLFKRQICGCGMQPVNAVDYAVSQSGEIQEVGRKLVQERRQKICVD